MKTQTQSAAEADNVSQHVVGKDNDIAQLEYTVEQLNDRLYDTTRKLHDAKTTIYRLHDHINDLNSKMCGDDTPSTDGGDVGGD